MSLLHRAAAPTPFSRRIAAAVLLTATVGLGACTASGGSDFEGQAADVEAAVEQLADRAGRDDAAGICSRVFTKKLADQLAKTAGGDCTAAVQRAVDNTDYTSLLVNDVVLTPRTQATSAVATVDTIKDDVDRQISLVREGKQWRIASFDLEPAGTTPAGTTPADEQK